MVKGFVYMLGEKRHDDSISDFVKIGFSKWGGEQRMEQTFNPRKLFVVDEFRAIRAIESKLHMKLSRFRVFGEWFQRCSRVFSEWENTKTNNSLPKFDWEIEKEQEESVGDVAFNVVLNNPGLSAREIKRKSGLLMKMPISEVELCLRCHEKIRTRFKETQGRPKFIFEVLPRFKHG